MVNEAVGRRVGLVNLLQRCFWLLPLGFYVATASRTPGWVDAPLIARTVHRLELSTWVNHHNLFTLLGGAWLRLTPDSVDPHYALNLLCSMLGALTVYVVFRAGIRLTDNVFASMLGATVLMVSHSLWWHSTMLEVYTLSTLLLALVVLFVVRFDQGRRFLDLCAATFFFGLACSNHIQMGLLGFGFVGLLASRDSRRLLLTAKRLLALAGCFLAGFQVYLWVFAFQLADLTASGTDLPVALDWMIDNTTGGGFKRYMFPPGLSIEDRLFWWAFYAGLFIYNLPLPWLLFAPVGFVAWTRRASLRGSLSFFSLALVAQVAWSSNYLVWDMYAFALPAYVLVAVLVIMGIDWVMRRSAAWRRVIYVLSPTVVLIPVLYGATPHWITRSEQATRVFERIPEYVQATAFWEPLDYFLNPNKLGYDRVQRYSRKILGRLEPNACFWGNEATMFYPLKYYYQDVLGERRDVSYHLAFGILESENEFAEHARLLGRQLQQGCPVYVSSLGYPDRNVLNHLYAQLDATQSVGEVARLPNDRLVESFPRYQLQVIDIDEADGVRIFRLAPR